MTPPRGAGCKSPSTAVHILPMTCLDRRRSRPSLARPWAVVVLLGLAMLLRSAELPHLHKDSTPGLYNEAHVLEALTAVGGDTPVLARATLAAPAPLAALAAAAPDLDPPRPDRPLPASRAPPAA